MLLLENICIHTNINNIYMCKYSITYIKNALTFCTKKIIPNTAHLKQSIAVLKFCPQSYCIGANLLAIQRQFAAQALTLCTYDTFYIVMKQLTFRHQKTKSPEQFTIN